VGREHPHLPASLEAHQEHFGRAPELLAADRGLYSVENEKTAKEAGVKHVVLPKSGRLSQERERYEKQRWFSGEVSGFVRGLRDASASSQRYALVLIPSFDHRILRVRGRLEGADVLPGSPYQPGGSTFTYTAVRLGIPTETECPAPL
jgi:hypothetical protein